MVGSGMREEEAVEERIRGWNARDCVDMDRNCKRAASRYVLVLAVAIAATISHCGGRDGNWLQW